MLTGQRLTVALGGVAATLVLGFIFFCCASHSRRIELRPGDTLTVVSPSLLAQLPGDADADVVFSASRIGAKRVRMFEDLFAGPILFLPGESDKTWFCVFDYDVIVDVLVFDLGTPKSGATDHIPYIVPYSDISVRLATDNEISTVRARIGAMSEESLRKVWMPSSLLGPLTVHFQKNSVLDRLEAARHTIRPKSYSP